ncbi:tRNA(Ile)-lysidine synthase [Ephemeroptericola cinctiostellae]|uniref:tRNA(Ile)-lysidine synthase n=1 Tax=Ephemeroptericola cinctiostellae TaxID=2268024 RepID=A0A345DBW3_9BURK|nr:tRNA lysidine(34) synthetase TilS [Ephemeroptericola cinctiostellae]AXF85851.1 tRNA(Ile)-lysidine synthase [Ephemeroptericola cinctiostellae]
MVNIQKNNPELSTESGESITAFLLSELRKMPLSGSFAVAVSGGMDSMALLHASHHVACERGVELYAFHVHHGLQAEADAWVEFVQGFCADKSIHFNHVQLDPSTRKNAQSIEDWARQGRYAALAHMAQSSQVSCILLAQHEDDQIETHLLQKARGAGARGQAAMPTEFQRFNTTWRRPWLSVGQAHIRCYVAHHVVPYVFDPSNLNPQFARNALRIGHHQAPLSVNDRLQILTDIQMAQMSLAHDNAWAEGILLPHYIESKNDIGEVSCLQNLILRDYTDEQQATLIRHWLASVGMRMPTRSALKELIRQLNNSRIDQHMCWKHPDGGVVTRFRNTFIIGRLFPVGHVGKLKQLPMTHDVYGVDIERLKAFGLTMQMRSGGERIHVHPKRPIIDLKLAYQNAQVPPMLRAHLPLIYCGDALVYAAGIGMNIDECVLGGQSLAWSVD